MCTQTRGSIDRNLRSAAANLITAGLNYIKVPPLQSVGRLYYVVMTLAYVLLGMQLEEEDIASEFGPSYYEYRKHVPALVPRCTAYKPASKPGADSTATASVSSCHAAESKDK